MLNLKFSQIAWKVKRLFAICLQMSEYPSSLHIHTHTHARTRAIYTDNFIYLIILLYNAFKSSLELSQSTWSITVKQIHSYCYDIFNRLWLQQVHFFSIPLSKKLPNFYANNVCSLFTNGFNLPRNADTVYPWPHPEKET